MLLLAPLAYAADNFVLVRDGAVLQAGQDRQPLATPDGAPVPMRLVEDRGSTLVVAPLDLDDAGHCSAVVLPVHADVRVTIARDDALNVLTQTWTEHDTDGSTATFRAGTWMSLGSGGRWTAQAEGARLTVTTPMNLVGSTYTVDGTWPSDTTPTSAKPGTTWAFGSVAVTPVWVGHTRVADDGTVTGTCFAIHAPVTATTPSLTTVPSTSPTASTGFSAKEGTPLSWLDGSAAGTLQADTVFTPVADVQGRVCLDLVLAETRLQACMARESARPLPVRPRVLR